MLAGIVSFRSIHTINSCHNEADLGSICCASEMSVDLLGLGLIKGNEAIEDVVAGRSVIRTTCRGQKCLLS